MNRRQPTAFAIPLDRDLSRRAAVRGLAGLAALVALADRGRSALAQDATPTPAAPKPPGVTTLLGRGLPAAAPGYALLLQRVANQPGDVVATHVHPGAEAFYVEAGAYAYTGLTGDAYVTRGSDAATPPAAELAPVGTEIVLHTGDSLFQDRGVVHTIRVVGDAPASLLLARLFAADQAGITFTDDQGTPAP